MGLNQLPSPEQAYYDYHKQNQVASEHIHTFITRIDRLKPGYTGRIIEAAKSVASVLIAGVRAAVTPDDLNGLATIFLGLSELIGGETIERVEQEAVAFMKREGVLEEDLMIEVRELAYWVAYLEILRAKYAIILGAEMASAA